MEIFTFLEFLWKTSLYNSLATPYQDWDEGIHTVPEYKRRFRRTNIEMACALTLNIVVSLVMLVPLWYTGKFKFTKYLLNVPFCVFCRLQSP